MSRALAWLTTGLKGVAIGLALGWHIQSRPGGLRGAVSDVSEIARGALQRYPRLLALLTSATDSLSRVLSAALLRPSAALARRGSLVLGAIASHGAPGPLAALGVLCGAAMAVHLALTRARDSADDVDGAGADDFRQVAREAGEIPVPAAGSAGVPIDLGKTLEGMGLKARQYGHLPMRIAHEGCGTGMATVVTREVLAEHGARKRGGCFGGFKPPEEVVRGLGGSWRPGRCAVLRCSALRRCLHPRTRARGWRRDSALDSYIAHPGACAGAANPL